MNFFNKIIDKLFIKQWCIAVADEKIDDVIRKKKISSELTWIPINNNYQFQADPFIFKSGDAEYNILYEEFDYYKQYGYISQLILNKDNNIVSTKVLLETKSHLSYPFIFKENGKVFVFPESSASGKLSRYQYDETDKVLLFKEDILNLPLLDSTIVKFNSKYWIFCTMRGENSNEKLFIYYADNLSGPYASHAKNPVKTDICGARPAGNFIEVDGILYRPAQNSKKYYGASVSIYKIKRLDENNFIEEHYMSLMPDKRSRFNTGIHTINYDEDKIVIDGLRKRFFPISQVLIKSRKHFNRMKSN